MKFFVFFLSTALFASSPTTIKVKGLVCSFCARGVDEVFRKENKVERFEVRVPEGEVVFWSKKNLPPATDTEIKTWIERAGLEVKEITP